MDGHRFDGLTELVAVTTSRRRFSAGFLGLAAAVLGLQPADAAKTKVQLCHATGDSAHPYEVIKVSQSAAADHLGHGDEVCNADQVCTDDGCCDFFRAGTFQDRTCGTGCCRGNQTECDESESRCCRVGEVCGPEGAEFCCPVGQYCLNGGCAEYQRPCSDNAQCNPGETCLDGTCCENGRVCGSICCAVHLVCESPTTEFCSHLNPNAGVRRF